MFDEHRYIPFVVKSAEERKVLKEKKKQNSSTNFSEAAIEKGFPQHFHELSPVMLPSGVY